MKLPMPSPELMAEIYKYFGVVALEKPEPEPVYIPDWKKMERQGWKELRGICREKVKENHNERSTRSRRAKNTGTGTTK